MSATTTRKTSAAGKPGDRVVIFDTTLRDGEQSPGASMNLDEKIKIALLLEEMGVDVIEAGFPIASNGDYQAASDSVTHARKLWDDVVWSCEDGSRSEHDFLCRTVESAIKAGARTINT